LSPILTLAEPVAVAARRFVANFTPSCCLLQFATKGHLH
jgi:hypothetical protein